MSWWLSLTPTFFDLSDAWTRDGLCIYADRTHSVDFGFSLIPSAFSWSCWWVTKSGPQQPPVILMKPYGKMGYSPYQLVSRISEPSTVSRKASPDLQRNFNPQEVSIDARRSNFWGGWELLERTPQAIFWCTCISLKLKFSQDSHIHIYMYIYIYYHIYILSYIIIYNHCECMISEASKNPSLFGTGSIWYWPWHQAALGVSERSLVAELAFQVTPMQAWSSFWASFGFILEI